MSYRQPSWKRLIKQQLKKNSNDFSPRYSILNCKAVCNWHSDSVSEGPNAKILGAEARKYTDRKENLKKKKLRLFILLLGSANISINLQIIW
jgi:hypothetical protein